MSTTLTVNRKCSRCPRVEQTEVTVEQVVAMAKGNSIPTGPTALTVSLGETPVVEFPYLCAPCNQIVARYIEHIAKQPKHQSALRGDTKIEVEEDDD